MKCRRQLQKPFQTQVWFLLLILRYCTYCKLHDCTTVSGRNLFERLAGACFPRRLPRRPDQGARRLPQPHQRHLLPHCLSPSAGLPANHSSISLPARNARFAVAI